MVDYIANYMDTLPRRRVTPEVDPGYLRNKLPGKPPRKGDKFEDIMNDVEKAIMPGVSQYIVLK
jgi:aromatic-L-amino-acid decarboxylase